MKAIVFKIVAFSFFLFAVFSCEKEEENIDIQLVGKWKLSEKIIGGSVAALSECEKQSTIELKEKNLCLLYDACNDLSVNSGWSYKSDMLNISEYLPAAFYVDQLDKSSMTLRRNDISPEGNLQVTVLKYNRTTE